MAIGPTHWSSHLSFMTACGVSNLHVDATCIPERFERAGWRCPGCRNWFENHVAPNLRPVAREEEGA